MNSHKLKEIKRAIRRPFEWLGIFLGIAVFSSLTHSMLFDLCDLISWFGYRLDRKGRELSRANLRIVMAGKVNHLNHRREEIILRRSYRNMMRTIGHVFWTCRDAKRRAAAVGELSPVCKEILKKYEPIVTVSGHIGCWEILSQLVHLDGHRMMSVAKDIGSKGMTEMLMKSRRSIGQVIIHADGAFRPLMQGIKDGYDLGLLVDQVVKVRDGGIWVRFFGQPVPVSAAPAFFSAKGKAPAVVAWSRPLKDGRYRCELVRLYPWEKGIDIWGRTQQCISDLEGVIRRHPSCWVLNYRYFRKKPTEEELAQLVERERKAAETPAS